MSTTLSDKNFDTVGYSGRDWDNRSRLDTPASGEASSTQGWTSSDTGTLVCTIPALIETVPDGSAFVEAYVSTTHKKDFGITLATPRVSFGDGDEIAGTALGTSYSSESLGGDKDYWGMSGTNYEIMAGIKDGSIPFRYRVTTSSNGYTVYVKDIEITLTYVEADTSRASILITMGV